ncbi:MAG: PGF-pre-PGF domain-containing protein, partial [Methanocorpusculum sp.]|nr:PGF-pre-PGF domain-containing protein [Methanocorpusculum sp.]
VDNASFLMSGGEISGNTATDSGGAVYNYCGTFTMSGGKISGNTATKQGGGVFNWGTFTMTDGEISGNTATSSSGGVYNYRGTFTMSGGEISGNTATVNKAGANGGGGVGNYDLFILSGGKISGNSGRNGAAIMIPSDSAVFQMTGGEISGNAPFSTTGSTIALTNAIGATVSLTGGSVIDNIGSGLVCDREKTTVIVGGSILFSNNTGGPHLSFSNGGTLYLTGGTFKKGEHGSSALDMKNANIYLSGPVTFDTDLPFDVLSSNGVLTIDGDFTGSIKSFKLEDEALDDKDFIKIDSEKTSQKPSEIINRFALSDTNKWTLVADDSTNTIKTVLNKPVALSGAENVTVKWINATIANVSIRLDPNANDATDVQVKLGGKTSQTLTGTFTKGSTISGLQITGLTAGSTYSVTADLKNTDISNNAFTYTDILAGVTAPEPCTVTITGEGGAEIPSTGILLPQANSMTFSVLVKDKDGNILKDEPVIWSRAGTYTTEDAKTATTITLIGGNSAGTDTLTATAVNNNAVSGTATITVTSEKPTTLSIEADKTTIALGDTVHLTVVATDNGGKQFAGYDVAWSGSATATSKTGAVAAFTPTSAGSYSMTATVTSPSLTAEKTITVVGKPTITTNPNSATYTKGQTGAAPLTVSAAAPGSGTLTYQWQTSTDPTFGADVTDLETSETCTPAVTTAGTFYYRANVTYTESDFTTYTHSTAAKITVLEPIADSITLSPSETSITIETGQTATFTAAAWNNTLSAELPDAVIVWSVENGGASASIVQTGNQVTITGTSAGTAVISATSGSIAASVIATVTGSAATHVITATAGAGGSISPNGAVTVVEGHSQTFTITPASGYTIAAVTVDGTSFGTISSYTFQNVAGAHTIAATFREQPHSGSSDSGSGSTDSGSVSATGQASFGTTTGVTDISFAKGTSGTVTINTKPTGVTAPANSYTVVDITGPVFEGYAQIEFSVPVAVLTDNGYTVNDITLQHYTGGQWVRLDTTYLGEERGAAKYVAATRSFSPFAIVYEKGGAPTIEKATPEPTGSTTARPTVQETSGETRPTSGVQNTPAATTAAPDDGTPVPTLTQAPAPVFGALAGLLAAGVLFRRRE